MNLTTKIDINNLTHQCKYIGKGTFGKVFIKNLSDFGKVAIKKIIYIDEEDFKYFENEFRILKIISELEGADNYTPHFYGYWQENNLTYFIFEGLSINLFQYQNDFLNNIFYKKRYLPLDNVRNISLQILQGLNFLHSNGIVHCDLKPSNIVFCDNCSNKIKIIDFGLSKKEGEVVEHKVQTVNYRAPEVWMNEKYECPIDMWSFGAILYEMLIGDFMFCGEKDKLVLGSIYNRCGKFNKAEDDIIADPWQLHFINHHSYDKNAIDLIKLSIEYNVESRLTAEDAICHSFYVDTIE